MQKIIVVDIDNTVARMGERKKYLQDSYDHTNKDQLELLFQDIEKDAPIETTIRMIKDLAPYYLIVFLTSRDESVRAKTTQWIDKHVDVWRYDLIMRKENDFGPCEDVKPKMFIKAGYSLDNIFFVLDDIPEIIEAWKKLDVPAFLVQEYIK
jgi:hypothetical protein